MLYKKVHRQYLREFRIERRFKYRSDSGKVYKIKGVPKIGWYYIEVKPLILIKLATGEMFNKDMIEWLED